MNNTAAQLRLLIANDLLRCDEIAAGFESLLDGDTDGQRALYLIATRANATLQEHQRQLAEITFPTAAAHNASLAGSLVTTAAPQSGIL